MSAKRSQAALEFLTTYGWAFLLILVMIGALDYFGVLNPNNLVPDSCFVSDGFSCLESGIQSSSTDARVKAILVKSIGEPIIIDTTTAQISNPELCEDYFALSVNGRYGEVTILPGEQIRMSIGCEDQLQASELFTTDVTIAYKGVGRVLDKTFTLSISQQLQANNIVDELEYTYNTAGFYTLDQDPSGFTIMDVGTVNGSYVGVITYNSETGFFAVNGEIRNEGGAYVMFGDIGDFYIEADAIQNTIELYIG